MTDSKLTTLLASELTRHLQALGTAPTPEQLRLVLHAVKGSAALAQCHDLSLVASQLGARVRSGETAAAAATLRVLHDAARRLQRGEPPFETRWPTPPPDLLPSQINSDYRSEYVAVMTDHLREIDSALDRDDPRGSLEQAYRTIHTMKSTAASAGDDVTAWYCHGLESRLREVPPTPTAASAAVGDLARHRALLAQLLDQPSRALQTMRARDTSGSPASLPATTSSPTTSSVADADIILRVPTAVVDAVLEQLDRSDFTYDELLGATAATRNLAAQLRDRRADLLEGLRELAAQSSGNPAYHRLERVARALATLADGVDNAAHTCRRTAESIHTSAERLHVEVAGLRKTTARWLFDRVHRAVRNFAPAGQEVQVQAVGADLALDRRIADALLEPVLQLARNAVAHGLEAPTERRRSRKPEVGTISLRAERHGAWLRITVADDGRGVDLSRIRALAVQRGDVAPDTETDLLALLFLPGLSTREGADILGGRGVGLELAQDAVRALGGTIRLATSPRSGLSATVEVPIERGLADVLWVRVGDTALAIPASHVVEIAAPRSEPASIPLAQLLGLDRGSHPRVTVALTTPRRPVTLGVDDVVHVEQVLIRPIPPLVAAVGPYNGAILRSDGSLRLALDPTAIAARAWAHAS